MQKGHSLKHCRKSLAANLKFERVVPYDRARSSQKSLCAKIIRESEMKRKSYRKAMNLLLMLCMILYLPVVQGLLAGPYMIGEGEGH